MGDAVKIIAVFFLLLTFFPSSAAISAVPCDDALSEIPHLLDYVKNSECRFYRNGKWHDRDAARSHLERKYRYLLKKGAIKTTEDFIERAASKSSMSGERYQVRCGTGPEVSTNEWFTAELLRYRRN